MSAGIAPPTQAYLDALKVLERYRTEGVTREESDAYIQAVIDELESDTDGKFPERVAQVGRWAIEVDEAFDRVTRGLTDFVGKYGSEFPELEGFQTRWTSYNQQWDTHLKLSRDVASEHAAVLKRFDQVYIDMVLTIQTVQDREDVIVELETFISEEHDRSTEMYQGFLNLKRDVEAFVTDFDKFVEKTGTQLDDQIKQLLAAIEELKKIIPELDKQIEEAAWNLLKSTFASMSLAGLFELGVAGYTLFDLINQRKERYNELLSKQEELRHANEKQEGLANMNAEFDGLRPSITLICDKLILFAEIWSSVRNQAVQFRETLKGGTDASTNARFKLELKLAREICTPLTQGLERYATELVNRPSRSA